MGMQNYVLAENIYYDAQVNGTYQGRSGELIKQVKQYKTVSQALQDVPAGRTSPYRIYIKNGRYYEKITVDKKFVSLIGESKEKTILTFDANADTLDPQGMKYTTFKSASVEILADHFQARDLTIENSWDYNANWRKENTDKTKVKNPQAVALKMDLASDQAIFQNVKITGFQDTLYLNAGRTYFYNSMVSGNVDFIFGAGCAVFDSCHIVSRDRGLPETQGLDSALVGKSNGFITAPSTQETAKYGFLFIHSRLLKEQPQMADESVTLGRPWHPTTNLPDGTRAADPRVSSAVAYIDCYMEAHVSKKGWDPMAGKNAAGAKIWFTPETSRFVEYGSTGPGAKTSETRTWVSAAEAENFTILKVLCGWNPVLAVQATRKTSY